MGLGSFVRLAFFSLKKSKSFHFQHPLEKQDARNRALELGDKARKDFDLEAEAEVKKWRRESGERRERAKQRCRRFATADVSTSSSTSSSDRLLLLLPRRPFTKTHNKPYNKQLLNKTVLEDDYENKPIARPRY